MQAAWMLLAELSQFTTSIEMKFLLDNWRQHSTITMATHSPLVQILVVIGNMARSLGKVAMQDVRGQSYMHVLTSRPLSTHHLINNTCSTKNLVHMWSHMSKHAELKDKSLPITWHTGHPPVGMFSASPVCIRIDCKDGKFKGGMFEPGFKSTVNMGYIHCGSVFQMPCILSFLSTHVRFCYNHSPYQCNSLVHVGQPTFQKYISLVSLMSRLWHQHVLAAT